MRRYQQDSRTFTIVSMIFAPLLYVLIGQMVSNTAAAVLMERLTKGGVLTHPLLQTRLQELLLQNNVLLSAIAALITIPLVYCIFYKRNEKAGIHDGRLLFTVPLGMAACVTLNLILNSSGLNKRFPSYNEMAQYIYQGKLLFELIGIAFLPAVVEELIYRGVLYKGFRQFFDAPLSAFFSALVFGAVHMNMVQFFYAGCLGLLFAWVYERYQNLWAPILLHMAANAFSVLVMEWKPLKQFLSTSAGNMALIGLLLVGDVVFPILICRYVDEKKEADSGLDSQQPEKKTAP